MWWIIDFLTGELVVGFESENDAEYELCHNYNQIEYGLTYEMKE